MSSFKSTRRGILGGGLAVATAAALPDTALAAASNQYDLICLGASPAGLTAAIVAHDKGLKPVVVEATDMLGGGTARSNGGMWIPLTRLQKALGFTDSREAVFEYIRATSLGRHDETKLGAYLDNGDTAIAYVNAHTPLKVVGSSGGDYFNHLAGSRIGRLVWPDLAGMEPLFKQTDRYPLLRKVRGPGAPMSVGGQEGTDSWGGGTALIGGLVAGCIDRGIPILMNVRARRLLTRDGRVSGVAVEGDGGLRELTARRAVLIATGGYEFNPELVRSFVPYPEHIFPMTAPGNRGDGHIMGMELGAATAMMDCAVWMAALHTPGDPDWGIAPKGTNLGGASFIAMPGMIFVNALGKRVCDEGFYPAAPRAIFTRAATKESEYANLPLFVILDQAARDRYGIGPLAPGDDGTRSWLIKADSLASLAEATGIDPVGLETTVKRYNKNVASNDDPDFGRGRQRANAIITRELAATAGRVHTEDNRSYIAGSLAPLQAPPYYAARLGLASIGNRGGLVTDIAQRVLDWHGKPIPGLLAGSNAAAQLAVGGGYSSGQSIGLSLVGGYIAGHTASNV